jgi:4-hydroxy-2-oxoglutarate aldolase
MDLSGIFPALTTPFEAGRVAGDALRRNIERYALAGVAGYLVLGSTGEAMLLDERERALVLETARAAIPSGRPMIVGIHGESTAGAVRQIDVAAKLGADVALVGTPHYFRDQMTAEALIAHYVEIASRVAVPLLLYNVPKFTGLALPLEVIREVGSHDNVIGIKESSGDPDYLHEVLGLSGDGFDVLCGASSLLVDALTRGAVGGILAAADVFPEACVAIAQRVSRAGAARVAELDRSIRSAARVIAGKHGVPGVKAAMDVRGLAGGDPRRPLLPVSPEIRVEIEGLIRTMAEDGILA